MLSPALDSNPQRSRVALKLVPQHFHAHAEHNNFFLQHFVGKGREAVDACAQTIRLLQALRNCSYRTSSQSHIQYSA